MLELNVLQRCRMGTGVVEKDVMLGRSDHMVIRRAVCQRSIYFTTYCDIKADPWVILVRHVRARRMRIAQIVPFPTSEQDKPERLAGRPSITCKSAQFQTHEGGNTELRHEYRPIACIEVGWFVFQCQQLGGELTGDDDLIVSTPAIRRYPETHCTAVDGCDLANLLFYPKVR